MRIKKTSQTTPIQAQVVNTQSNSTTDSYSCDYVNGFGEETLIDSLNAIQGQAEVSKTVTADLSQYRFIEFCMYNIGLKFYFGNMIFPTSRLKTSGVTLQNRDMRWNVAGNVYGISLTSNNSNLNNFGFTYFRADTNFTAGDVSGYEARLYGIK